MHAAENVADHAGNEDGRHPVPDPARAHEEHRDRVGEDVLGVVFVVGGRLIEHPAALGVQEALERADIAIAEAVELRAVGIADVIGIEVMAAVVGDPFRDRALHGHLGDGAEEARA